MLKRIEDIQGIGLLHDANGKPYACQKATLLYGDNGRGKSTLAAILRSVSTNDPSLIESRKTIDGTLPAKVVLQFESGHKVLFSGGTWSERRAEVSVFDSEFIERNVYSGSSVSTGQRKNLLEFALGEAAVSARLAADQATVAARTASELVQSLTAQLSGHHTGMTLAAFTALSHVPDADKQIENIQGRIVAANRMTAILAKAVPKTVQEPMLDIDILFAGLRTSLDDVHADAESVVKRHAHKLNADSAESWLSQGQSLTSGSVCPYCDQSTTTNDLMAAYKSYFNTSYIALKARIAALNDSVLGATSSTLVDVFMQGVAAAAAQTAAWLEQAAMPTIEFDGVEAGKTLAELRELVSGLLSLKRAAPADPIGSAEQQTAIQALWQEFCGHMQLSNSTIQAAINAIANYKSQLVSDNVQQLQQQVNSLQAAKRRHAPAVVSLLNSLAIATVAEAAAEAVKTAEREKLDALMSGTLTSLQVAINTLLKNFGASFSITGMSANFRGLAPRSEYGLLVRGKEVALEGGAPTFATTLSDGDKRTLAFAFFVASTLADPKLSERIIVIDDPMCSLDRNRRHYTRSVLRSVCAKSKQIIVLAHDPYFLQELRNGLHSDDSTAPIASFQLGMVSGGYSSFIPFDVDRECESPYFKHHRILNEFATGVTIDNLAVAKAIRPMLEGYLHRRFPRLLPTGLMFGQMVVMIRDAAGSNPLSHAQNVVPQLNEINEYAGQFHHDTNANADSMAVVASELMTFVDKSLALVHKGAP